MGLAVVYPISLVIVQSFQSEPKVGVIQYGLEGWQALLSQPSLRRAALNSLSITLAVTVISFPIGAAIAWILARTDLPGRNHFEFLFWLTYFLPTLTVTLSWVLMLDPKFGLVNQGLALVGLGPLDIYSFWGIVWVHLVSLGIAVKVILLTPAFRNMNSAFEEASVISGASRIGSFFRIGLPLIAPALLSVLLLSILALLEGFQIEQILGPSFGLFVVSTKIYDLIGQATPLYNTAAALGISVLALIAVLIVIQRAFLGNRRYVTVTGQFTSQQVRLGAWKWPVFAFLALLTVLTIVVPLVITVLGTFMNVFGYFTEHTWTLRHWQVAFTEPDLLGALKNTLIIGIASSALGLVVYAGVAYAIVRGHFTGRRALDFVTWLPSTIPGIVLSLAFVSMSLNVPLIRPLYGTTAVLVLALVISGMPLGVQVVRGNLAQLAEELEEAALVTGAGKLRTILSVTVPLLAPTLAVVAMISFMGVTRSVAQVALLSNSANQPLSILQLNHIADGHLEDAMVIGCLSLFMTLVLALVARRFGYGVSRRD